MCGREKDGVEPADAVDDTTRDDGTKDKRQDKRECVDTRGDGICSSNTLEPDGQCNQENNENRSKTEGKDCAEPDISDLEQTRWDSGVLLLPDLDANKDKEKHAGKHKKCNDAAAVPGVFLTTPLKSKDEADDSRQEDEVSPWIELLDLLLDRDRFIDGKLGEEKNEASDSCSSDGKTGHEIVSIVQISLKVEVDRYLLDVKAPSPSDVISKSSSDQGRDDRSNAEDGPHHAHIPSTFGQRRDGGDEDGRARVDARRACASNGTSDDEGDRVGCHAAEEGTKFKEENGNKVDGLGWVKGKNAPPKKLSSRAGDEISAGVPTDITEGVEVICDARDGSGDDCAVQGDEEHGYHVGEDDGSQFEAVGVLGLILSFLRLGFRGF
ncbi:unnamed protein product [Fusarium graminearum]|nr:unnamed protein product [Fusarium graminearum]